MAVAPQPFGHLPRQNTGAKELNTDDENDGRSQSIGRRKSGAWTVQEEDGLWGVVTEATVFFPAT